MATPIALILKGYPRLSETFIAQEIRELEKRGLDITLVSLRHPTDKRVHPIHREIQAPVIYLPEYLYQEPGRVLRGLARQLTRAGFYRALGQWLRDLVRDPTPNRVRRFGQALVLARELPPQVGHLYAHFIHTPASVTRYTSLMSGLPWSASAHAKDIWTIPDWELKEKLDHLQWLATCTAANHSHLQGLAREPAKVKLVYHGLDFKRFDSPTGAADQRAAQGQPRDGATSEQPVRLISVGRAVPKKGYNYLLEALAHLPSTLHWRFTHIGGGELLPALQQQAEALGIAARIDWLGALPQEEVLSLYRQADLFVLASRITGNGDRDGLPNVLMEAQSQRLCCLSTRISGIPELIVDGRTGLLVEQCDVPSLAQALEQLITDPLRRSALAEAGYQRVRSEFSLERGIDQLAEAFQLPRP